MFLPVWKRCRFLPVLRREGRRSCRQNDPATRYIRAKEPDRLSYAGMWKPVVGGFLPYYTGIRSLRVSASCNIGWDQKSRAGWHNSKPRCWSHPVRPNGQDLLLECVCPPNPVSRRLPVFEAKGVLRRWVSFLLDWPWILLSDNECQVESVPMLSLACRKQVVCRFARAWDKCVDLVRRSVHHRRNYIHPVPDRFFQLRK